MTPVYLFPPRTRRPPGYSTSPGPHHLHVVYQQGAPSSRRDESPMVPGQDCMEDGRMCPNGIHHAEGLCQPGGMWACIVMDQNNAT